MSFTSFIIFTSIMTRSNFYFETFVHFAAIHVKFMEKEAGNRKQIAKSKGIYRVE